MNEQTLNSMPVLHAGDHVWRDEPVEPSWIVSGSPHAEVMEWAQGSDGRSSAFVWRCTPGTFRWQFGQDEYVYVISGHAHLRHPKGTVDELRPGTAALFRAGDTVEWEITETLTKCAILVSPLPAAALTVLRGARRAVNTVKSALGR